MNYGKWGRFVDGKFHELTVEEIQELTSPETTLAQFGMRLRAHACVYGLHCSIRLDENGIRFRLVPRTAESEVQKEDRELPRRSGRGMHADCDHPRTPIARKKCARARGLVGTGTRSVHRDCTHPTTERERAKCRERRKKGSGAVTDLDPELLGWVREFIREQESATVEDIAREFFPDEPDTARLYLDQAAAEKPRKVDKP
ncbi:hypothetical protein ACQEV4_40210 [Streptomyces shenzhenensis]|uniref:hypothetical protein n=1 Tax=Streptomyces shenzhenensis TaxID=943815 RepID=UPI003D8F708A